MKKEVKLVTVGKDTIVGMAFVNDIAVGSAMLDSNGKSVREIERDFINRFLSQLHQKKLKGADIPFVERGVKWDIKWYDYNDVTKTHIVKENVMEKVLSGKPKCYSIEKRDDGSLKVNKIDGKLYDEDELKVALCKMALEG